jgi:ABC-type Na+ transport system ATPase subunit NatA
MIRVTHLVKKYGDLIAVNDISFDVAQGEIFAFLGPNGAGKTTTIRSYARKKTCPKSARAAYRTRNLVAPAVLVIETAGRPVGNFLFLGPTGSGKTRIVEATAQCLLNDSRAVIICDCTELYELVGLRC